MILSLFSFKLHKTKENYTSDLIISTGMFFSVFGFLFLNIGKDCSRNLILTPIVVIWTILAFWRFNKR